MKYLYFFMFFLLCIQYIFGARDPDCLEPIKTGRCRGYFERYAYNSTSRKCQMFVYGGCQANNNNFQTLSQCERKCMKS
ncbi:trypsin inhibitor-like [Spodoptera frugiperda]|uniref:Trypsin inhibitor-like n=1 Tax=Spodoptera frugiperda TaxID=7108 RepID=A0A9R0DIZ4_SPOFR|nr:trypsin inhibitor-like [Spodoptera frugiperda]